MIYSGTLDIYTESAKRDLKQNYLKALKKKEWK